MSNEPICPRPCNGRPDDFTMAECILSGECGCTVKGTEYGEMLMKKAAAPTPEVEPTAWVERHGNWVCVNFCTPEMERNCPTGAKLYLHPAPGPEADPVVWIIRDPFGNRVGYEDDKERSAQLTKAGYNLTPLYTHSTPADVTVIDGFIQQDPSSIPTTDEHNAMLLDQIEELREALHPQVARNRKLVAENAELVKVVEEYINHIGHYARTDTEARLLANLRAELDKDKE